MKKRNWGRFLWIVGVFLLLIWILLMVMDYKIHYEYLSNGTLYFYACDGVLCVSEVEQDQLMYSKYDCLASTCPDYIREMGERYAVLADHQTNKMILFDYLSGKVVSGLYDDYLLIDANHIIATLNKKKGVIDSNGKILVDFLYDEIGYLQNGELGGYNFSDIIAISNGKYGIISYLNGSVVCDFSYSAQEVDQLLLQIKNPKN